LRDQLIPNENIEEKVEEKPEEDADME